ncbi:MAG: PAS domain-containing sensor histidine kinase [Acidimicrobiales bacterium]
MLTSIPVPVLITDLRGRILHTNRQLDHLFGYDDDELTGSMVEVLLQLSDRLAHPELREAYVQLTQRRQMASYREITGLGKGGHRVPVDVHLQAIELDGSGAIMAAVIDVRRWADKLNRARQALDAASSGMVMVDDDGVIMLVNAKLAEMFGYENDDLIGSRIETLVPAELRRRHDVYRRSFGAEPTERMMETGRDLFGQRADGSTFPLEIGLMPIEGRGERLVMATVIDTTERRHAEHEIERRNLELLGLNAELVQLNSELEQVAHSASHDLKAPLTTLDGLLSCVAEDLAAGDHESVLVNVDRCQALARRLGRLIEDILGLAGPDHHDREWIDFAQLIALAIDALQGTFTDHQVTLSVDVPPCRLFTSPIRVSQIVQNLLSNAAKFSHPARPERRVSLAAEVVGTDLVLTVSDNGIGIPPGHELEAFARYGRVANHEQPGTGLGLALVKRHVDQMGGTVSYESSSEGTTFRVDLPNVVADPDATPEFVSHEGQT